MRYAADDVFAARMAYCGPRGIPLSTFLAWPEADQLAALAWSRFESERCPRCHTHPSLPVDAAVSTDEAACLGCKALSDGENALGDRKRASGWIRVFLRAVPRYRRP